MEGAMNIIIYTKNLELPPGFKKQIEEKFNKLAEFTSKIISFRADLSHDSKHRKGQVYRVEVNLNVPGTMFRVVENDFDLSTGVNKVRDKLARQITEHKRKIVDRKRIVRK